MPTLKVWDGAAWVVVSGPPGAAGADGSDGIGGGNVQTKTAAYTILSTDGLILADATTASFNLTAPAVSAGRIFTVKKIDPTVNVVTVLPASGLIDGAANVAIGTQWSARTFISNGTDWFLI